MTVFYVQFTLWYYGKNTEWMLDFPQGVFTIKITHSLALVWIFSLWKHSLMVCCCCFVTYKNNVLSHLSKGFYKIWNTIYVKTGSSQSKLPGESFCCVFRFCQVKQWHQRVSLCRQILNKNRKFYCKTSLRIRPFHY